MARQAVASDESWPASRSLGEGWNHALQCIGHSGTLGLMPTQPEEDPNTSVPQDDPSKAEAGGRKLDPTTSVPQDQPDAGTSVPQDNT